MSIYYLDSSAIVKSYVAETGSPWVRTLIDPANDHELYTARIACVETISAMIRRVRRPGISLSNAVRAIQAARADFSSQYMFIEITELLIARAMNIAEVHGLRGYDAVHLAAAIELQEQAAALGSSAITFVGADLELNMAAVAEGLSVDNPDMHP